MAFISKKQFGFLLLFSMGTCMLTLILVLEFHTLPKARQLQTSYDAFQLQQAIEAYHADQGKWPPKDPRELLQALQETPPPSGEDAEVKAQIKNYLAESTILQEAGQLVDLWKQPLQVEFSEQGARAFSTGKDLKPFTEDDVDGSLWEQEAAKREQKAAQR